MNDGGCDPQGRFWCGTMAYDVRDGAGSLYRVEADGSFATALAGVTISNGLGWSPDGATAFYVDSMAHGIDRFAFDGSGGELGERRRFAEIECEPGPPRRHRRRRRGRGLGRALGWRRGAPLRARRDARRRRAAALRAGHRLRVRRRRPLAAVHHDLAARAAGRRRPGRRLALPLRARRTRAGSARVRGVAALAPGTLSTRQLNRATLARQLLLAREPIGPVEAIGRLCGLQAQEAAPPFIGLWTRLDGFEREHLIAALRDREVVRATLMRATLHLLGATDYAAFRSALMPVMERAVRVLGERARGPPARGRPSCCARVAARAAARIQRVAAAPAGAVSRRERPRAGLHGSYARPARHGSDGRAAGASRRWRTSRSPTSGSGSRCRRGRHARAARAALPRRVRPCQRGRRADLVGPAGARAGARGAAAAARGLQERGQPPRALRPARRAASRTRTSRHPRASCPSSTISCWRMPTARAWWPTSIAARS